MESYQIQLVTEISNYKVWKHTSVSRANTNTNSTQNWPSLYLMPGTLLFPFLGRFILTLQDKMLW